MISISLGERDKAQLPGANLPLYVAALTLIAASIMALAPPIFWRLPRRAKQGALIMFAAAFGCWAATISDLQSAFERTPAGAQEAAANAERRKAEAMLAASRARIDGLEAEAAKTEKQLSDYKDKAEGCFSWGHRLPALESPVKESLENPAAFEHVKTELIVPNSDRNNVMMTFRAQNGFGAIRTVHVTAQLIADDCTVQNIGQPTDD